MNIMEILMSWLERFKSQIFSKFSHEHNSMYDVLSGEVVEYECEVNNVKNLIKEEKIQSSAM